jgi:GntR family transcriptional regulator
VRGVQRLQSSLASASEAELLNVAVGSAILRIERRSFMADGAPVEVTRSAYRGDRYDFVTEIRDAEAPAAPRLARHDGGKPP